MSKKTDFNELQSKWYAAIKEDGFDDIEYSNGMLRKAAPRYDGRTGSDVDSFQSIRDYYYMAYHFLNEYKFEREVDKIMWEYHTNGISIRDIAQLLKDAGISKTPKSTVGRRLKTLEATMKRLYLAP